MARYEDLSRYAYAAGSVPDRIEALNVGWLEDDDVPRGEVPEGFLVALAVLCRDEPRMRMRGWQRCTLPHSDGEAPYPVQIRVGDADVALGSAEVRVVDTEGRWLIAPNLVHHYVEAHGYRPPDEFVEAVLSGRVAPPEQPA